MSPERGIQSAQKAPQLRPYYISDEQRPWEEQSRCLGIDPSIMVPLPRDREGVERAKKVCSLCVVTEECLDAALQTSSQIGVRGGLSESARRKLRKQRLQSSQVPQPEA